MACPTWPVGQSKEASTRAFHASMRPSLLIEYCEAGECRLRCLPQQELAKHPVDILVLGMPPGDDDGSVCSPGRDACSKCLQASFINLARLRLTVCISCRIHCWVSLLGILWVAKVIHAGAGFSLPSPEKTFQITERCIGMAGLDLRRAWGGLCGPRGTPKP